METLHCSFCGKSAGEIEKLVAGPGGIHICDECVALCSVIMAGSGTGLPPNFDPRTWPKERLLASLGPLNAVTDAHRKHLGDVVDALRRHDISWAEIGQALGVSRQTAWERFG